MVNVENKIGQSRKNKCQWSAQPQTGDLYNSPQHKGKGPSLEEWAGII